MTKPSGYDCKEIDEVSNEYHTSLNNASDKKYPNIIVIMNESYSDFCVLDPSFCSEHNILPFYHSLQEDTIKGYALTSVYGGKTPNAEFEFLTGNTMAFLPEGSIPYQQFIQQGQYSIVSILNSYGYSCMATHPYSASGWNRPSVYDKLGFQDTSFIDDYKQDKLLREYVSDQEMYEYIIQQYENRNKGNPWFLFGVTMQNHGGYDFDFKSTVSLPNISNPEAEQYLSVLKYSDQSLEFLINYFRNEADDVVIVMFGDHYPGLADEVYSSIYGDDFLSLDAKMNLYKIPFIIWANFDINEEYVQCTSLNYLANYMFEAAGLELEPYSQFLNDIETNIPAINALGFYSLESGKYKSFDEASEHEKTYLDLYKRVQYNAMFDDDHRNSTFFP